MAMTIRKALILSIAFHAAFLAPLCRNTKTHDIIRKDILVDYIVSKELVKPKESVKDKAPKIPETPRLELKRMLEAVPAPDAPPAKIESNKDAQRDMAERQARIKTSKDYVGYYQMIREKIRQGVKRRYRSYYGEGEVRLNFTLLSNGKLASSSVDDPASSPDRTLREIALSSLRDAAPFSPFPKAVSLPRMDFDVTIVFKKDHSSR